MGFRSSLIGGVSTLDFTDEFIEKYGGMYNIKKGMDISSKSEYKYYRAFSDTDFFKDIQSLMIKQNLCYELVFVLLHECGGVTRVEVHPDKIIANEPIGWLTVEDVHHSYCYGCSDVEQ